MDWFRLRSDSLGALANLMLCLVVAFYLLSISNKSKDGWRIIGLFLLFVLLNLAGFFANSTVGPAATYILQVQEIILMVTEMYTLWFIYRYRENPFPREMRLVLFSYGLATAIVLYFQPKTLQWTAQLVLLYFIWTLLVLFRKIVIASSSGKRPALDDRSISSIEDDDPRKWSRVLVAELQLPTTRISKSYRAFAMWTIMNIIQLINLVLLITGTLAMMVYFFKILFNIICNSNCFFFII